MSTETVSPLRQRMIEDMNARKLGAHSQRSHIYSCRRFAAFLKRPLHRRCPTSRDFVPWRFSVAGRISAWIASSSRRPKTLYGATFVKLVLLSSISLFDRVASHLLVPT